MSKIPGEAPEETVRKYGAGSVLWVSDPKEMNRWQHIAVDESRLHIPILFGLDGIHGYRTIFPAPIAMASPESRKRLASGRKANDSFHVGSGGGAVLESCHEKMGG